MDKYFEFIGKFVARPGKRDELLEFLLAASNVLRDNPNCLLYIMSTRMAFGRQKSGPLRRHMMLR